MSKRLSLDSLADGVKCVWFYGDSDWGPQSLLRCAFPRGLHRFALGDARRWTEGADLRLDRGELDEAGAKGEYEALVGRLLVESAELVERDRGVYIGKQIPPLYREEIKRERLPDPAAFDEVFQWTPGATGGLVAAGDTGLGKSRAVFALLAKLHLESGIKFEAVRAVDLKARVLELAMSDSGELAAYLGPLRTAPLLFIDDLAQASMTAVYGEKLFDLIEYRTSRGLPCLFSIQVGPETLTRKLSGFEGIHKDRAECLVRRMAEFCRRVTFGRKATPS